MLRFRRFEKLKKYKVSLTVHAKWQPQVKLQNTIEIYRQIIILQERTKYSTKFKILHA